MFTTDSDPVYIRSQGLRTRTRRRVQEAQIPLGGQGGGQVDVDMHVGAAALDMLALAVGVPGPEREDHRRHVVLHHLLVGLSDQPAMLLGAAPVQCLLHLRLTC